MYVPYGIIDNSYVLKIPCFIIRAYTSTLKKKKENVYCKTACCSVNLNLKYHWPHLLMSSRFVFILNT